MAIGTRFSQLSQLLLSPIVDLQFDKSSKLLVVRGGLQVAQISAETNYQIIIPRNDPVVALKLILHV